MAHIDVNGFDDVVKMLDKLSNKAKVDDMAKAAVDSAKDIVASSMRSAIASSEGHRGAPGRRHREDRSTGSVAGSVQATSAKVNSYGVFSVAKPEGRDKDGMRHGRKAALLEYGGRNFPARPWRSKAVSSAETPAMKAVEDYITTEMGCE